jgi:DNA-binding NtrC family response regulator
MVVVVVAEDEPVILMETADHLTDEGFTVLGARHAAEALDIFGKNAADIHLLFTDVRMATEMDGMVLSHHVSKHWPWIGVLVTSAHATPEAYNLPPGCRFVPKPYQHAHVVTHLRALAGTT